MKLQVAAAWMALLLSCAAGTAAAALIECDVSVELENASGEAKSNWPVILTVYQVFGRDLPAGGLDPKHYHVYGPKGTEIEFTVEELPPYDAPGNDEIIFVIPSMEAGQKLAYRVTHSSKAPGKRKSIDTVTNPDNLLANPGFEKAGDKGVEGYTGGAVLDKQVKRSGESALLLAGTKKVMMKYNDSIKVHPNSWYYFGVWCKTQNVARHGIYAGNGGSFKLDGFNGLGGEIHVQSQCYTRDWNKSRWYARHEVQRNEWGIEEGHVQPTAETATLELTLDQKKHFYMGDDITGKWWLDDAMFFEQPKVTVRFDQALAPHVKDGCFIFTRPTSGPFGALQANEKQQRRAWCSMPYPHEAFESLDHYGLKGQRVPFFFGLYHDKPLSKVLVNVEAGAVSGPDGAKIPVESVEYSNGYLGATHPFLLEMKAPVDFPGPKGVRYFNVTFNLPRDAKPGKYQGKIKVLFDGEKVCREIPITLRVQDMEMPILRDRAFGMIFQSNKPPVNDDGVSVYAKSGYSSITIFGSFLTYEKSADGGFQINLADLEKKMKWLAGYGITAGVVPFSDTDLGPLWGKEFGGGSLPKKVKTKEAIQREVKRVEELVKQHPDWPRFIWMTWDEPGGDHGEICEKMGWVNEAVPEALTYIDCMFPKLPAADKYYTMPGLDDPCDYAGPEIFNWYNKRNKKFGMAISAAVGERQRYQPGILMCTSNCWYMHAWHLQGAGLMDVIDKKTVRSIYMVAAGQGMDDSKIYRLLMDSIKEATASKDPKRMAAAKAAEEYIAKVFKLFDGDHGHASGPPPYLGRAFMWGYEQFYDDWQRQMARHAAAVRGVAWID